MKRLKDARVSHKFGVGLLFLGACALILIKFTDPDWLSPSDTIQVLVLLVLVMVTYWYAQSTDEMSRTANYTLQTANKSFEVANKGHELAERSYALALNAENNSVLPVIVLDVITANEDQIQISYQNVGKGPALGFRIWLKADDEQFRYLQSDTNKNKWYRTGVGVDQYSECEWTKDNGVLPVRDSGFDVITEYTDAFGRPIVSKLVIYRDNDADFKFGKRRQ